MSKKKSSFNYLQTLEQNLHKQWNFIVFFFIIYLMALHPFVIGPQGYSNITITKQNVFLFSLILTLFVLALFYVIFIIKGYRPHPLETLKHLQAYDYLLAAYLLVAFISACLSANQAQAWGGTTARNEGFFMLLAYVTVFFVVSKLYKPQLRDMLIFTGIGCLVALYGIFQFYGIDPFQLNPSGEIYYRMTFFVTMSNKNVFSAYLCLVFWTAAVLFIQSKEVIFWRFEFLFCALVVFYMMLCGDTESGYVGSLGALLLMFPWLFKDFKTGSRLFALLAGCSFLIWFFRFTYTVFIIQSRSAGEAVLSAPLFSAIICAVISLILFLIKKSSPFKPLPWCIAWTIILASLLTAGYVMLPTAAEKIGHPTLLEISQFSRGEVTDEMGSNRGFIWSRTMKLIGQHPVIGHGPDNFAVVFTENYGEEAKAKHGVLYDKAHNEYLQAMVDIGALGLGCLVTFYLLLLWAGRKLINLPLAMAVMTAIVCYLLQAFFNFAQPFSTPIMWMMLGILGALIRESKKEI